MSNVIDSFLVALGFEVDSTGAKDFQQSLESVTLSLTTVAATAAAAAAAIGLFVSNVANNLDELADFAAAEDYSAVKLQELGYAAQLNGSSLEAMRSTLSRLNKTIGEAAQGVGRGEKAFEDFGLKAKGADGKVKSFDHMLGEIADKMQSMDRRESIAMAEKLGIDRSLIPMLMKGKAAIEELREEARAFGASSEEDFATAGEFADSMDRTKFVLKGLANQIAIGLMPTVRLFVDGLRNWLMQHKEIIKTNLGTALRVVSAVIGGLWSWVMRLITGLVKLVDWMSQYKVVVWLAVAATAALIGLQIFRWAQQAVMGLRAVVAWFMMMNFSALLIPAAIGLAILAIALLIDEILGFKEGNDSFLGDLVKKYPQLLDVINAISDGVAGVISWLQSLWQSIEPAIGGLGVALINLFNALWPVIKFLGFVIGEVLSFALPLVIAFASAFLNLIVWAVTAAVTVFTWLVDAVAFVVNSIAAYVKFMVGFWVGAANMIKSAFVAVFDWLLSKFDAVIGKIQSAVKWVGNLVGASDDASKGVITKSVNIAAASQPGGSSAMFQNSGGLGVAAQPSSSQVTNVQQTNSVNIPGGITVVSPDPSKAGENVGKELDKRNRQAIRNGQSAVKV